MRKQRFHSTKSAGVRCEWNLETALLIVRWNRSCLSAICLLFPSFLLGISIPTSNAFSTQPLGIPFSSKTLAAQQSKIKKLGLQRARVPLILFENADRDSDRKVDEKEYVRVPRGRRGSRSYYDDDDYDDPYDDDRRENRNYIYDEDDDDDDYDEDEYEEEEYDLFGDEIIPNPLLDSMDPDGAAERFPELARDPKFWFEMFLFISFLNFLSDIGPRDYLPEIPWYPS